MGNPKAVIIARGLSGTFHWSKPKDNAASAKIAAMMPVRLSPGLSRQGFQMHLPC